MVRRQLGGDGFREVPAEEAWREVLGRGYERRVHALALADKKDWELGAQLAERRAPTGPPGRPGPQGEGLKMCEARATLGGYA